MIKTFLFPLCCWAAGTLSAQNWFTTGQNADLMVSGLGFNQTGGAGYYNHPSGLASNGAQFLVCDRFNNRILWWNTVPTAPDAPPDLVLGQPDFASNNPGAGKHQLNWPGNASLAANGKLAVADTENDRILLWNTPPSSSSQAADLSLYLPAFTPPGGGQPYAWPWGVWTDGSRLAAVATSAGAILFWNTFPIADNQPPDYAIKLPQFGTPRNISTDGSTYFFVGDHNAKVTGNPGTFFWNAYPTSADQPYDFYRDEWVKGEKLPTGQLVVGGLSAIYLWDKSPTSAGQSPDLTLHPPTYKNGDGVDVLYASGKLYVNNYNGNNILVFNDIPTSSTQTPDFAIGSPAVQAQTLDSIHYIQNPVPATDGKRIIVSSDFDRALYIWDQLPDHSGQAPDRRMTPGPGVEIWANTLHNDHFIVAGRKTVSIWNLTGTLSDTPSVRFINHIGTAAFTDLSGVALDDQFFYLADKSGKIYGWSGLPGSADANPVFTISNPGVAYGFLSSNGQYLCATRPEPPSAVYLYRVADLVAGNTAPFKTIQPAAPVQFNQATQAVVFGNALAVACRGSHAVYLWKNLSEAGDVSKVVVLGQPSANSHEAAIGADRLFMPSALLPLGNSLWVAEFKFSSRLLKFSSGTTPAAEAPVLENDLGIYPNPVAGAFEIRMRPAYSECYSFDLFDTQGRLLRHLFSKNLEAGKLQQFAIEANSVALPRGISFLRVSSNRSRGLLKIIH